MSHADANMAQETATAVVVIGEALEKLSTFLVDLDAELKKIDARLEALEALSKTGDRLMTFEERRMLKEAFNLVDRIDQERQSLVTLRETLADLELRVEQLEARPKRGRPRKVRPEALVVGTGVNNG